MSRVGSHVRWLVAAIAACSMGKDPPKPAPPPPATGTLRGHVTLATHGPGADDGRPGFTNVSPLDCTVHAGTVSARTGSDGSYTLAVVAGHVDVSFADCARHCCYDPPATGSADVTAGSAATLDWSCECDEK